MTIHCDRQTDSLYIELMKKPRGDSDEVAEGVVLDFDEQRRLVGIDVQHASQNVDLRRREADFLLLASAANP